MLVINTADTEYRFFFAMREEWKIAFYNAMNQPNVESQAAALAAPSSVADELMKFKSLLDSGAITESEYNSQKEKLLNP